MENILVSVLIPVFNAEETLVDAVQSMCEQTHKQLEIICINDGSSDKSLTLLNEMALKDSRIKIISRENKGIVPSLNEAMLASTGKYIARMDADDISRPSRIEKQVRFMEANPEVIACGTAIQIFDERGPIKERIKSADHDTLMFSSVRSTPLCHPTAFFRRDIVITNKVFYDEGYPCAQDVKFWFNMSQFGKLSNLPEVLLDYRRSDQQISKNRKKQQKALANQARAVIYQALSQDYFGNGNPEDILKVIPNKSLYPFLRYIVDNECSMKKRLISTLILKSSLKIQIKIKLLALLLKR